MLILAVDTATRCSSAALLDDDLPLAEETVLSAHTHLANLMPSIDRLLSRIDADIKDIDLFAAAAGPGSFTGLRVGVTTIKTLSFSLKKPALGISTLEGLACNVREHAGFIAPMIDARKKEIFAALYQSNGRELRLSAGPFVEPVEKFIARIEKPALLVGNAIDAYKRRIADCESDALTLSDRDRSIHHASSIGRLAFKRFEAKKEETVFEWSMEYSSNVNPVYVRRPEAEINRLKRKEKNEKNSL